MSEDTNQWHEYFEYDPDTGEFLWAKDKGTRGRRGRIAGTINPLGYRILRLNHKMIGAHRVAWMLVHGDFPQLEVDHIDGNPSNNRISNLRLATKSQNAQNVRRARSNNKLGLLGVCRHNGKYLAQINLQGFRPHLGHFDTAEEAHRAYVDMKRQFHERCEL